jgi:hypothetical protein
MARRRALIDGLLGGNRRWLVLGGLAWALKAFQAASRREPEVVYLAELQPGETLILSREATPQERRRG